MAPYWQSFAVQHGKSDAAMVPAFVYILDLACGTFIVKPLDTEKLLVLLL